MTPSLALLIALVASITLAAMGGIMVYVFGRAAGRAAGTWWRQRRPARAASQSRPGRSVRGGPSDPECWLNWLNRLLMPAGLFTLSFAGVIGLQARAAREGEQRASIQRAAMEHCNPAVLVPPRDRPVHIERRIDGVTVHHDGFLIACAASGCGVFDPVAHAAQFVPPDHVMRVGTTTVASVCSRRAPEAALSPAWRPSRPAPTTSPG